MTSTRRKAAWLILLPLALVVLVTAAFEGQRVYWDRRVVEMCEKEGGTKVFERVQLDAEIYDKLLDERKRLVLPSELTAKPADSYVFSMNDEYIARHPVQIRKFTQRVISRPQGNVLAQQISFARVGGDLLPLDNPSTFHCPNQPDDLFERTFSRRTGSKT